ncbi:Iaa16p [Orobanche gracilis]
MVDSMLSYAGGGRCEKLGFEETELRLGIGLPGGGGGGDQKINANYGKRGFAETVDLKLNLSVEETGNLAQTDLGKKDLKNHAFLY